MYYRRVVEGHKNQILIKVAEKVRAERAHQTSHRGKAGTAVLEGCEAIPQTLLLNGQNPLTLLHSALSAGLHEESDERCLELAQDIRVVLAEFADRLGQALKDEAELANAIKRLIQNKST